MAGGTPQHIQQLVIRELLRQARYSLSASAVEYQMPAAR